MRPFFQKELITAYHPDDGANRSTDGRKLQVCFLFIAQRHQMLHGISSAVALSRRPEFDVTVMSPSREHIAYARELGERLGNETILFAVPDFAALEVARRITGRSTPPKLLTLAMIASQLRRFDAIALPERTSIILKRLGLKGPSFIHLDHGAGDRAVGFDPRIRHFDFVLMAGDKHRRRLRREGLIRDGEHAVVGYPKFEAADAMRDGEWTPFPGDHRPIVLYNPHFSRLGSWEKFGEEVLDAFSRQDRYNLICAPHVRLLDGSRARSRWRDLLGRYGDNPRIFIDEGSDRSIDMTYTTLADVYLGDVSSQIYEFLRSPRPCLFLDAHGRNWKEDENYAHWHCGQVVREMTGLIEAIDNSREGHQAYFGNQMRSFTETFAVSDISGSERAAQAMADHLIGLLCKRRRADNE